MKWKYIYERVKHELEFAVLWVNENHPEWDVVQFVPQGAETVVIRREVVS